MGSYQSAATTGRSPKEILPETPAPDAGVAEVFDYARRRRRSDSKPAGTDTLKRGSISAFSPPKRSLDSMLLLDALGYLQQRQACRTAVDRP
ncbi:MAG: hypothetical protein R2843_12875 [Thermomicrobiales bacterium]